MTNNINRKFSRTQCSKSISWNAITNLTIINCSGDIISYANEKPQTREERKNRCTFAGADYFKRMKALGLYIVDLNEIKGKIEKLNLDGIFEQKLI